MPTWWLSERYRSVLRMDLGGGRQRGGKTMIAGNLLHSGSRRYPSHWLIFVHLASSSAGNFSSFSAFSLPADNNCKWCVQMMSFFEVHFISLSHFPILLLSTSSKFQESCMMSFWGNRWYGIHFCSMIAGIENRTRGHGQVVGHIEPEDGGPTSILRGYRMLDRFLHIRSLQKLPTSFFSDRCLSMFNQTSNIVRMHLNRFRLLTSLINFVCCPIELPDLLHMGCQLGPSRQHKRTRSFGRPADVIEIIQDCTYWSKYVRLVQCWSTKGMYYAPQSFRPFGALFPSGVVQIVGPSGFRGHPRQMKHLLPTLATRDTGSACKSWVVYLELSMQCSTSECDISDGINLLDRISV